MSVTEKRFARVYFIRLFMNFHPTSVKNTRMCIYHFINADMENTKVRMTLCYVTSPIQLNYLLEKM